MMSHKVKCVICGQVFDRDAEPYIQTSPRRYAHKKCVELGEATKTPEQRDLDALNQYIMKLFDEPFVNARTQKQIKDYHIRYNYSYSGMLKSLIYWYEVRGNSVDKANGGIGILPYIYQQAHDYYYNLHLAQLSNKNKDLNIYKRPTVKTVTIPSPQIQKKPHKLFFEKEEDNKCLNT